MAPWEPDGPTLQLSLKRAFILDLGACEWVVLCLDGDELVDAVSFPTVPSLDYTAHLRAEGYRITWRLVENLL